MEGLESNNQPRIELTEEEKTSRINKAKRIFEFFSSENRSEEDQGDFQESLIEFSKKVKEKYNANQYALYHALIQSGIPEGVVPEHFDFPGDDSVMIFVEFWEAEMVKLTKTSK